MSFKKDFPIFEKHPDLIYLDTGASAQKPKVVIDAVANFYSSGYANINRGLYDLSERSTALYDESRNTVARFIGASSDQIIFTRGATESINLLRYVLAGEFEEGDTILVTVMEHHSNFVPWFDLAKDKGLNLKIVELKDGELTAEDIVEAMDESVKLVCCVHVSNSTGLEIDVEKVCEGARKFGAKVLVDASQSVVHQKVDVEEIGCDFLVFSGHKLYGPTGIGVLYAKDMSNLPPFNFGGDMIKYVEKDEVEYLESPQRYEAGTPNISGAIGLAKAIEYLEGIGMHEVEKHDVELVSYAEEKLSALDFVELVGKGKRKSAVSFVVEGVHPHDVAQILSDNNVAVRAGHHCTQPLNNAYGHPATVRFSFGVYNDKADIDKAIEAVKEVKKLFG